MYSRSLRWDGFSGYMPHEETQFKQVEQCLVRKDHSCGKFIGASKSCFIACPSTEEVETLIALIGEKLTKIAIEPVVAIKERAYGQDIFCTKICGKIIESQFCLVILDDVVKSHDSIQAGIPNPNVYYEYGLMTALRKYIIPLQKEGQVLAFNIQTHDTIKYNPRTLSSELDKALRDADKFTKDLRSRIDRSSSPSAKRFYVRSLEIAGFQIKDYGWFLREQFSDTNLIALDQPSRQGYAFLAVVEDKENLVDTLTDMQVILKRLEAKSNDLRGELGVYEAEITRYTQESANQLSSVRSLRYPALIQEAQSKKSEVASKLSRIQSSIFAMVLLPQVADLKDKATGQYAAMDKEPLDLPLSVGDSSGIRIGDTDVPFKLLTL